MSRAAESLPAAEDREGAPAAVANGGINPAALSDPAALRDPAALSDPAALRDTAAVGEDEFAHLRIQSVSPHLEDAAAAAARLGEGVARELGLSLARLHLGAGQRPKMQILIERDGKSPTLDDCVNFSRELSRRLDLHDMISTRYLLEVSSPGVDRPLTAPRHFQEFAGREVRVKYRNRGQGPRRAVLAGLHDGVLSLAVDKNGDSTFVVKDDNNAVVKDDNTFVVKDDNTAAVSDDNTFAVKDDNTAAVFGDKNDNDNAGGNADEFQVSLDDLREVRLVPDHPPRDARPRPARRRKARS
ncbi:MAG: hypothetical protein MPK06_08320 [Alphaproteobacteria bacterium]|nr:hypothetical protein [Alphaproteobacteria bacterium]MDA8004621.1 hypothetical protein [Alphaproteobacteria bacterium]MDA8006514.1 hypothetical protein [Alphaproteobacteria bacterium]MDA8013698.1 hypothetical protein [Alphaproteobacteria bacterium]